MQGTFGDHTRTRSIVPQTPFILTLGPVRNWPLVGFRLGGGEPLAVALAVVSMMSETWKTIADRNRNADMAVT